MSPKWRALAVAGFAGLTLLDSVPRHSAPDHAANLSHFLSDRRLAEQVGQTLPTGSKVLQLPYLPFPESGPRYGCESYDHFRLYCHDLAGLVWSHGVVRGRYGADLVKRCAESPPHELLAQAVRLGFAAVVIDRRGYNADEVKLIDELSGLLNQPQHDSYDGRYAFFSLAGRSADPREMELARTAVDASFHGFRGEEGARLKNWRWAIERKAALVFEHRRPGPLTVRVSMTLHAPPHLPADVSVGWPDGAEVVSLPGAGGVTVSREVVLPPGKTRVELASAGGFQAEFIYRLWFRVENLRVEE